MYQSSDMRKNVLYLYDCWIVKDDSGDKGDGHKWQMYFSNVLTLFWYDRTHRKKTSDQGIQDSFSDEIF